MEIIADPQGILHLDPAVRRFLDSAWGPPSTDPATAGQRQRRQDPALRSVLEDAAKAFSDALQLREMEEIVYSPAAGRFEQFIPQEDETLRAYRILVDAFNERRDLGTCQYCGSLMLPGRGRIAKFCSSSCRMAMNRTPQKAWDGDFERLAKDLERLSRKPTLPRRRPSSSKGEH
jgi:ribosomal protein L24E